MLYPSMYYMPLRWRLTSSNQDMSDAELKLKAFITIGLISAATVMYVGAAALLFSLFFVIGGPLSTLGALSVVGALVGLTLAAASVGITTSIGTFLAFKTASTLLSSALSYKSSQKKIQTLGLNDSNEVDLSIKKSLNGLFINKKAKVTKVSGALGTFKEQGNTAAAVKDEKSSLYQALNHKRYGLGITFFGTKHWISFKSRSLQRAEVAAEHTVKL